MSKIFALLLMAACATAPVVPPEPPAHSWIRFDIALANCTLGAFRVSWQNSRDPVPGDSVKVGTHQWRMPSCALTIWADTRTGRFEGMIYPERYRMWLPGADGNSVIPTVP